MLVYGLGDPRLHDIRYVGKTCRRNARGRLAAHISRSRLHPAITHKEKWVARLLVDGVRPELFVLEELPAHATRNDLDEAESFWISYLKSLGSNLTNATPGGDGWAVGANNPMHDPVARAKYSLANKGRKLHPDHKRLIVEATRNRSPEFLAKQAAMLAARNRSPKMRFAKNKRAAKLTIDQVMAIRERHASGERVDDLIHEFPVKRDALCNLIARRTWKNVGPV